MKNYRDSIRKEIIKITAQINEKETKETIPKISKTTSCFSEKINKTDHQPDSSRKKGRRIKSTKLEMKMDKSQQTKHRNTKDHKRLQSANICQ